MLMMIDDLDDEIDDVDDNDNYADNDNDYIRDDDDDGHDERSGVAGKGHDQVIIIKSM